VSKSVIQSQVRGKVTALSKDGRTATVELLKVSKAGVYSKVLRKQTVVHVDVLPGVSIRVGESAAVVPCRRVSKLKSWRVVV
jgi:ribosomal protein S17